MAFLPSPFDYPFLDSNTPSVTSYAGFRLRFGERFATSLLLQSILMIAAQLLLLELCVTLRRKNGLSGRSNSLTDIESFWNWPYFATFLQFIGILAAVLSVLTLLFVRQRLFVEVIGVAALGLEAMLAVPQAYSNWKNQSAEGLNLILIATWFLGDTFKTIIFITSGAPFQFLACGLFQLCVDCIILAQLYIYKAGPSPSTQIQR